jgi:prepilin-type N-terminal cleavage/methylation domain-containing protein
MARKGFTLIELLVAMSVASVVMLLLLSLMGNSSDTYKSARDNTARRVDARSGLHLIKRDLSGRLSGTEILHEMASLGENWPCDEFGFYTAKTATSQGDPAAPGDVCFVRYYVAENDVFSDGYSRKLYRQFLTSSQVKNALENGIPAGLPATDPNLDEVIAVDVCRFAVNLLTRPEGSIEWVVWVPGSPSPPMRADISLTIVDAKTARRLKTSVDWDSTGKLGTPEAPREETLLRDYPTRISLR